MHAAHRAQCTDHGYSFEISSLNIYQYVHQDLAVAQGFFFFGSGQIELGRPSRTEFQEGKTLKTSE
jgi:hypothetical protein